MHRAHVVFIIAWPYLLQICSFPLALPLDEPGGLTSIEVLTQILNNDDFSKSLLK